MSDTRATASRPQRVDARRNRERLLDVAKRAFDERGTEASLDEIARRARVGIGTLYRHFPTRDALIAALVRDGVDDLCRMSDELTVAADPFDALERWLRALVGHAATFRGLAASIASASVLAECSDPLSDTCAATSAAAGALIGRARDAGRIRADVADADILDLVASVAWIRECAPRDDGQRDRLLALVLDAVRVEHGRQRATRGARR